MESEKNLNGEPSPQELPDESLEAVAGGGELTISALKYSYIVGSFVLAKVPKEEWPMKCGILERTYVKESYRYCAAYKVRYRSVRLNRFLTRVIREDDILRKC